MTDKAGNSDSDTFELTWDTAAPVVDAGADMVINTATQKTDASASDVTSGVDTILWTFPANVICSNTGVIDPTFSASVDGVYTVTLTVTDKAGNSDSDTFELTWDVTAPIITNILVTFSDPIDTDPLFGWVNITCTVTDALSGVDEVHLYLEGSPLFMQNTGSTYYYNTTLDYGNRTYYIHAKDDLGNAETSATGVISVPPNWDINEDGVCDIFDVSLISAAWLQEGASGWIREDINNDGKVDILDVSIISLYWLQKWYT